MLPHGKLNHRRCHELLDLLMRHGPNLSLSGLDEHELALIGRIRLTRKYEQRWGKFDTSVAIPAVKPSDVEDQAPQQPAAAMAISLTPAVTASQSTTVTKSRQAVLQSKPMVDTDNGSSTAPPSAQGPSPQERSPIEEAFGIKTPVTTHKPIDQAPRQPTIQKLSGHTREKYQSISVSTPTISQPPADVQAISISSGAETSSDDSEEDERPRKKAKSEKGLSVTPDRSLPDAPAPFDGDYAEQEPSQQNGVSPATRYPGLEDGFDSRPYPFLDPSLDPSASRSPHPEQPFPQSDSETNQFPRGHQEYLHRVEKLYSEVDAWSGRYGDVRQIVRRILNKEWPRHVNMATKLPFALPELRLTGQDVLDLLDDARYSVQLIQFLVRSHFPDGIAPNWVIGDCVPLSYAINGPESSFDASIACNERMWNELNDSHQILGAVVNVHRCHFIVFYADATDKSIHIVDSLQDFSERQHIQDRLIMIVNAVCAQTASEKWHSLHSMWTCSWNAVDVYFQQNSVDCGVHAVQNFVDIVRRGTIKAFHYAPRLRYYHAKRVEIIVRDESKASLLGSDDPNAVELHTEWLHGIPASTQVHPIHDIIRQVAASDADGWEPQL